MIDYPFTQSDADGLVHKRKFVYIHELPLLRPIFKVDIHMCSAPKKFCGLELRWKNNCIALVLNAIRIRCIDYRLRKHDPGCPEIQGWHQHVFTDQHGPKHVVGVPQLHSPSEGRIKIVQVAFDDWNIELWDRKNRARKLGEGLLPFAF